MGTRKIAPAIAAGCTMVVKPAQQTPLSMLALAQILEQAGLPGGVLNVITAKRSGEVIEPLLKDSRTRKLSFTGSTEVGRKLIEQSAEQILRVSMELGGNAPFLVFEDADLDAAVDGAMLAKMRNVGEACTAANRFHVHESLADEFARRMAERMGALKVGRGTDPDTDVGPLIDADQRDKVAELVADATERGARLLLGGERVGERGYFYAPTVLGDVPRDARLLDEEIFGPVAPVATFASDERGDRRGQPHRVRARRLRLHARPRPRVSRQRGDRDGDGRAQPGRRVQPGRAVRRRQAVGLRPRGGIRGDRRVPGDEVRGAGCVGGIGRGAPKCPTLASATGQKTLGFPGFIGLFAFRETGRTRPRRASIQTEPEAVDQAPPRQCQEAKQRRALGNRATLGRARGASDLIGA